MYVLMYKQKNIVTIVIFYANHNNFGEFYNIFPTE